MKTTSFQNPYKSLFLDAIRDASLEKASDVHIKPTADGVEIIFRVMGLMNEPWKFIENNHKEAFINEVKRATNLSVASCGRPQDSRVSFPELKREARVNLTPTHYGEKIVLRIFDPNRNFSIQSLGLSDSSERDLIESLSSKNGVILVSGPTGSGKTTTLYSLVHALDRKKLNIVTVEDPVECTISGVTQIGINKKLSFASALRAILRQDPDVILVGEIRDEETADLCFKAASTGHLVLSTIHANDSQAVVQRLLGLGVERYLIENCLRFSAAQRLVKNVCQHCSTLAQPDVIPTNFKATHTFRVAGKGCHHCKSGYTGFSVLLEYMDAIEIARFAKESFLVATNPKVSLKESFFEKARIGLVDITEVRDFA